MSRPRPTVCPQLLASLIETTPDRVRRRLDRAPTAAAEWTWQASDEAWSVEAGGETVTLAHSHVAAMTQIRCSCLLAPRCFHVLACLTCLKVAVVESVEAASAAAAPAEAAPDGVMRDDKQLHAVRTLVEQVAHLLRVGVAGAGVAVQSGLLRAVHQCRAEGLHRLAALGLRISAGTSEFRARAPSSDPAQLAEDVADVLETSIHLLRGQPVAGFWIGTAGRQQFPVRPRRLHGLFAEPIVTRSGFAGAAVYFLGDDDCIYTASDVRPGDVQQARNAYLGGIDIGPLVQPARQLARGLYLGTDLTASQDGRLGRGRGIKVVEQGTSTWQADNIQQRFHRPVQEQCDALIAQAMLPADARRAGWDLVFLEGTILGALGPELLLQATASEGPLRLGIENDSKALYFRENLRMLSHAPGLRLQVIARLNARAPTIAYALAISPIDPASDGPRLEVPAPWAARVCLGFDEIQAKHLVGARSAPVVLIAPPLSPDSDDPLTALRRRWIAALLSGSVSARPSAMNTVAAETAQLGRLGFATGAGLLDALYRLRSDDNPTAIDAFLATALYLRRCTYELARRRI